MMDSLDDLSTLVWLVWILTGVSIICAAFSAFCLVMARSAARKLEELLKQRGQ